MVRTLNEIFISFDNLCAKVSDFPVSVANRIVALIRLDRTPAKRVDIQSAALFVNEVKFLKL